MNITPDTTTTTALDITPGRYRKGEYDSPNVLRVYSAYARSHVRLGIGYISPDGEGRQVFQGPMVPGPWAYTYPLAVVIDNYGGTAAEAAANKAAGLERDAKVGDRFQLDGRTWVLTEDRPHSDYPTLTLLAEDAEDADALTDELEPAVDAIAQVLTDVPQSPSALGRKAKVTTTEAQRALVWMERNNYCTGAGNGAWRNYRLRRFGEYS
jgi:hypothetical protein